MGGTHEMSVIIASLLNAKNEEMFRESRVVGPQQSFSLLVLVKHINGELKVADITRASQQSGFTQGSYTLLVTEASQ